MYFRLLAVGVLGLALSFLSPALVAQDAPAGKKVSLVKEDSPDGLLKEMEKQTSLRVADRRREKPDFKAKVSLQNATFWQALDAIAEKANLSLSLYQADGVVALVDGPHRRLPL